MGVDCDHDHDHRTVTAGAFPSSKLRRDLGHSCSLFSLASGWKTLSEGGSAEVERGRIVLAGIFARLAVSYTLMNDEGAVRVLAFSACDGRQR